MTKIQSIWSDPYRIVGKLYYLITNGMKYPKTFQAQFDENYIRKDEFILIYIELREFPCSIHLSLSHSNNTPPGKFVYTPNLQGINITIMIM